MPKHYKSAGSDRDAIAALLARYPAIDQEELQFLRRWFLKTASAQEVGLLASEASIQPQYRAFRAEHIDRLNARDFGVAALWLGAITSVLGSIAYLAP
ncbi:hypothetical protein ACFSTD_15970 [Novosphingobium colocasiae]|uniref:Uncharacterized protein n=1 Tax=Novosphingobium colocasiae TaxID=1256513 RepID=A0A918UE66_9SPHN|nr:hypothetical protein [Novosphingobium colocasiae]GGY94606.1 hypothetical protein GCM10011614_07080 [Novosphingobium colocasiae]